MPVKQVAEKIRQKASLYMDSEGHPGPLANTWGWMTIARTLNQIADEISQETENVCWDASASRS